MRKMIFVSVALFVAPCAVQAQTDTQQAASPKDTITVSVNPTEATHQFRLEFFVVNSVEVAGMPVPVSITAEGAKMKYDSISYEGGRVGYFQLKTQNPDTANQTLLLGLIADLSGSKPPLKPGRGVAFNVFYTADKAINASAVKVEPVMLAPANILEFNVLEEGGIGSVVPTFHMTAAKATEEEAAPEKESGG